MKKNYQTPLMNALILNPAEDILESSAGRLVLGTGDYDGENVDFSTIPTR